MGTDLGVFYVAYVIALLPKIPQALGFKYSAGGHTTHLQCELQEKEASQRDSSAGCPIVHHRKRLALSSKSKFALAEDGLVSKYLSRNQTTQGTIGLHQHESDIFEGSYGYHPISRQFEILTNLQKEHRLNHVENPPQLRLAPPAVYHEKVKKGIDLFSGESSGGKVQKGIDPSRGESSSGFTKIRKTSKREENLGSFALVCRASKY